MGSSGTVRDRSNGRVAGNGRNGSKPGGDAAKGTGPHGRGTNGAKPGSDATAVDVAAENGAVAENSGVAEKTGVAENGPAVPPPADPAPAAPAGPARRGAYRTAVAAVLVGVLVTALVAGVFALLPPRYDGRVGLLALPVGSSGSALLNTSGVSTSYGEVVTLAMPSIADLATSPTLLAAVAAEVPGSPTPDDLSSMIGVELLAGSGVARVSVHADSAELAGRLAEAVSARIADADLLAPAGELRVLDPSATVEQTAPDTALGLGLGLIAGLVAGLVTALVLRLRARTRRGGTGRAVLASLAAAGHGVVPMLDGRDPALTDRALVLARAAGGPVRVVAGASAVSDVVLALRSDLAREPVRTGAGARDESLLLVVDRSTGADEATREVLDAAVRALPSGARVLAVVVA